MKRELLLLGLLVCGTAQAANWVLFSHNNNYAIYADTSRVKITGNIRSAWFKAEYKPHTKQYLEDDAGKNAGKYEDFVMSFITANCHDKTYMAGSFLMYFEDGTNDSITNTTPWEPVPPDTNADQQFTFLCNLKQ